LNLLTKTYSMSNRTLTLAAILVCTLLFSFVSLGQSKLTAKQWQQDLRFLQTTIHNDYSFLFKKVMAKDFDAAIEKLYKDIPVLEAHEIPIAFSRIVSLFQYGHTQIRFNTLAKNGVLPINLYLFNDGVYIEGVQKEYKEILGAKLLKIGDTPIDKAIELVRPVVPVENDSYFNAYGLRFLKITDVLHAQKIIEKVTGKISLTLEKNGKIITYSLPTIALKDAVGNVNFTSTATNYWLSARSSAKTPLYLKYIDEKLYYFEYLEASKTVYVRQSSVFNDKNETLKDFYKRLFSFIDSTNVEKLIYDVRLNGGGNNYNNLPLIKGIMARPQLNKKGSFFYIIGRNTFSAAQNLTNEIGKYTEAIILGEPTAENVNFYGDANQVTLPNSKINTYISHAWWQDRAAWENRDATLPHIAVDMSFEEYSNNQDPVLEKAINYKENGFILDPMEHLTALFIAGDFETLKADGAKFVKNPAYKYYDFEKEFTNPAQRLLSGGRLEMGLLLFEFVTELFPDSSSAIFNLANAQEVSKQFDKAKASFKKVIAAETNSTLGKSATRRLKQLNEQ